MKVKRLLWPDAIIIAALFCLLYGCARPQAAKQASYEDIKGWMAAQEKMTIIDVRPGDDYATGHLQDAINIDLAAFVDPAGGLIDGGEALTSTVPAQDKKIIAYSCGDGNELIFADAAVTLGYTNVYYYAGGTVDWSAQGDYYVIEYEAFKAWHDEKYPFADGKNYLIDTGPVDWYTGDDPAHPGGHIPGAINLPVERLVDGSGNLIDNGRALADTVADTAAIVIMYCGSPTCGYSREAAAAAVAMGYPRVFRFQGGQQAWVDKGNDLAPGFEP